MHLFMHHGHGGHGHAGHGGGSDASLRPPGTEGDQRGVP
jgi:hypothetical protein